MTRTSVGHLDGLADEIIGLSDAALSELLDGLDPDELELIELAMSRRATDPWRADPARFAEHLDGEHFNRWRYVQVIADTFARLVEADITRAVVMVPARYGKTTISSQWGPAWALDRYPWLQVVLASYGHELAVSNSLAVRDILEQHAGVLRAKVRRDKRAAGRWRTTDGGQVRAVGVGSGLTGHGGDIIVIDDPFKDWMEAHSPTVREKVWNWYKSVVRTRLQTEHSAIMVVGCLTADAGVLMADGSERSIADVRPGDRVMTYERCSLVESTVANWADQGPDDVYAVRMESGRMVRANARHPFLTIDAEGTKTWRRTDRMRPGMLILATECARGHGEAPSARTTDATDPLAPKGSASATTTLLAGPQDTDATRPRRHAERTSGTGTGSTPRTSTGSSPSKAGYAPSADDRRHRRTPEGGGSCSPTTATTRAGSAGSSATTATSSSATAPQSTGSSPPPSTYALTPDRVVSVILGGHETVYDIEVDRTHNFVANGLVTHNTRWHEDDLVGRLLEPPDDSEREDWHVVRMPALAEDPNENPQGKAWEKLPDPLGRAPGEPLEPARFSLEAVKDRIKALGSYLAAGMEFQRPSSLEGGILKRAWWKHYGGRPDEATVDDWVISWDSSFDDTTTKSSYCVGQVWARVGAHKFLLDQVRDQMDFPTFRQSVISLSRKWSQIGKVLIENKANGPAVIKDLYGIVPGLIPREPIGSKESRAHACAGQVEGGNVWLPDPGLDDIDAQVERGFVHQFIEECALFPGGSFDDQVDSFTQALIYWQGADVPDTNHYRRTAGAGRR